MTFEQICQTLEMICARLEGDAVKLFDVDEEIGGDILRVKDYGNDLQTVARALLRESYSGSRNAGKPHVLEGDLSWQQAGMSALDLDWIAGRTQNAREIAVVLGVPSEMLGDSTNKTYANFETARKSFYTETVLPLMDRLRDRLNAWLVPTPGSCRRLEALKRIREL